MDQDVDPHDTAMRSDGGPGVIASGGPRVEQRASIVGSGVVVQAGRDAVVTVYSGVWADGVAPPPLIGATGVIESPYRGLGSFTEQDAALFFGRDNAIDLVVQRLADATREPGIVMVSGVSGAGKSSLLRAGVVPRLRAGGVPDRPEVRDWLCLVVTPGEAPLDELAVAVAGVAGLDAVGVRRELRADPAGFALTAAQAAGADRRLVLVVDQFEQLFTRCPDETQRRAFVTALHAAATTGPGGRAVVVVVVRADFETRAADYPELTEAIQHRYLLTAMTERQLRLAITEPAKKAGARVEDELTEQLLREVRTRSPAAASSHTMFSTAGVLPLVSYALDRAWRGRSGDTVTAADYDRTGGIERAVAESAQRAYDVLSPARQQLARRVFLQLTVTDTEGIDTSCRVDRADLVDIAASTGNTVEDVDAVLEGFATERLLILAACTVEISHEVLLTAWPLLRDTWLADTHTDRIVATRLRAAATEWDRHDRDPAYLYTGSVLDTATATAARVRAAPARYPALGEITKQFLATCTHAHRSRVRQRRHAIVALVLMVVVLAVTSVVAVHSSQTASHERDLAVAGQLRSESLSLAATDPFRSRFDALAAWRLDPTSRSRLAMLTAASNPRAGFLLRNTGAVSSTAFSPDGHTLAVGSADGTVQVWDMPTHRPIGQPLKHEDSVDSMAFSPDGHTLAVADVKGVVQLWDTPTHQPIGDSFHTTDFVWSMVFSPDGRTLTCAGEDDTVGTWDVTTHQPTGSFPTTPTLLGMVFSPDGRTLASNDTDGTLRLWDVTTRRTVRTVVTDHPDEFGSHPVVFSGDGHTLATVGTDGTVRLWDVPTLQQLGSPYTSYTGPGDKVALSSDGRTVAIGEQNLKVQLWDVASHQLLENPVPTVFPLMMPLAFSPDDHTLILGDGMGTVELSDLRLQQIEATFAGVVADARAFALSADGHTMATASADGMVRVWDVGRRQQIGDPFPDQGGPTSAGPVLSGDGRTLAIGDPAGIRLWNVVTHQQIGDPITVDRRFFVTLDVSSDDRMLVLSDPVAGIRLWDLATHQQIGDPIVIPEPADSVTFSPDNRVLAIVTGSHPVVRLWDIAARRQIGTPLTSAPNVQSVALSPDGRTLAVIASLDATGDALQVWDIATQTPIETLVAPPRASARAVTFSPDGRQLIGVLDTGVTVGLWDTTYTIDPASFLCAWAAGSFDQDVWKQYVPAGPQPRDLCP